VPNAPILNVSHDREAVPGANAVFPSDAHRKAHRYGTRGRVIPHGVRAPTADYGARADYFAYLSMFHEPKGPKMAAEAARLAGVPLIMAGPTPPAPPPGVRYVGPLEGADKWRFLARARALLFPASTESAGLVALEAQAVGTPAIVSAYGGAAEQIHSGVTGYTARDTLEMVEAIGKIDQIERARCAAWVASERSIDKMIDAYEQACRDLARGERW